MNSIEVRDTTALVGTLSLALNRHLRWKSFMHRCDSTCSVDLADKFMDVLSRPRPKLPDPMSVSP